MNAVSVIGIEGIIVIVRLYMQAISRSAAGVMYTCDAFGAHYCQEDPFDTALQPLAPHFRFYYDCLMRPNARSVLTALRKTADLPYTTIATGHGPILRYNMQELVGRCALLLPEGMHVPAKRSSQRHCRRMFAKFTGSKCRALSCYPRSHARSRHTQASFDLL